MQDDDLIQLAAAAYIPTVSTVAADLSITAEAAANGARFVVVREGVNQRGVLAVFRVRRNRTLQRTLTWPAEFYAEPFTTPMVSGWCVGSPPAIGWYVASTEHDARMVRYWSGRRWSAPTWRDDDEPRYLARARATPADIDAGDVIEWQPLTADKAAVPTA